MKSFLSTAPIHKSGVRLVSAVATLLTLVACGGGGGGDVPSVAGAGAAVVAPTLQLPYAVGSEELSVLALLNNERSRCGFGVLKANAQLDAAARAHADYQIINNRNSHLEDPLVPDGFTGIDPQARVRAQGYTNAGGVTDEYLFFASKGPITSLTGLGQLTLRVLLNAPYHLNGLMTGYRDIGISVRSNTDTGRGANGAFVQINSAYKADVGLQQLGATEVNTYPCEGASNIGRILPNETPNPVPGRDLSTQPLGSTVYIEVREGNSLAITNATFKHGVTGQNVILRAPITGANDPYAPCVTGCFKAHQGYVVSDAPLEPNTPYIVSISGTNNGAAFSKTFTFTTGS